MATQGKHERFGHAHDREGNHCIPGGINGAIDPDHANTKQLTWDYGKSRIVVRVSAIIIRLKLLVGGINQSLDQFRGRQMPSGNWQDGSVVFVGRNHDQ